MPAFQVSRTWARIISSASMNPLVHGSYPLLLLSRSCASQARAYSLSTFGKCSARYPSEYFGNGFSRNL